MTRLAITSKSIAGTSFTQAGAAWAERATLHDTPKGAANCRLWIRDANTNRTVQVDLPPEGLAELQAIVGALLDHQAALCGLQPKVDHEPYRVP